MVDLVQKQQQEKRMNIFSATEKRRIKRRHTNEYEMKTIQNQHSERKKSHRPNELLWARQQEAKPKRDQ